MEKELKTLTSEELLELYNKINSFNQFLDKEYETNKEKEGESGE